MTNLTERVFGLFIHTCLLQPESCLEYLAPETIWVDEIGSVQGLQGALGKAHAAARGWARLAGSEPPELTRVVELPLGDTERVVTCLLGVNHKLSSEPPVQIPLSVLFKKVQRHWQIWHVHCQIPHAYSEEGALSFQTVTSCKTSGREVLANDLPKKGNKVPRGIFFDELIDLIPGGVFRYTADEQERMDFVSEKLLSMLGYTEEEFREKIQNRFSLMIYEEDRARVLEEIEQQIAVGTYDICEYRIQTKGGELRWYFDAGHLVVDESGQPWFYVVLSDITEQKRMQIEATRQLSFLHTSFDSMPCGIVHYQVQGTGLVPARANRAACMLFGCFTEQEFLERYARRICPLVPETEIAHMESIAQKTFLSNVPESCTLRISLPDDSVRWLTAAFEKLQMPDGTYQVQAIYTDESEHQESAVRLQALVSAIPSCLIVYQVEPETGKNSISYITEGVYDLLGYTRDEFFGAIQEDPLIIIHPEDALRVENALIAAAREERSFSEVYRLRRKDGSFYWVRLDANIAERRGTWLVYYGVYSNMNDAKELEQQLRASSLRFETLVNSVPGCIMLFEVTGEKTDIKFLSDKVSDLLGYTQSELQCLNQKDPLLLVHPEDQHIIPEKLLESDLKSGSLDMSYRLRCKNGLYRWVRLNANLVERRGETRVFYGIYSDLDEVKQLEYELRASSTRYEALVESVPGGIAVIEVKEQGVRVTYLSEGIERLLGYPRGVLLAKVKTDAMSIVHPDDTASVFSRLQESIRTNTTLLATYRLLQANGQYRWVSLSANMINRTACGMVYYGVYFDSEGTKQVELELLRQQKKLEIVMAQAKINIWDYDLTTKQCTVPGRNGKPPVIVNNVPEGPIAAGSILPGSVDVYRRLHQAIQQGKRTASADIQYRTASGDTTWVRMRYVTVLDEEGRPITAIGSSESLEALKAIEQRYQEEMLYRETVGADLVASFRINISRRIVEEGRIYSRNSCVYDVPYDDAYIQSSVHTILSEEDRQRWLYNCAPQQLLRMFNEGKNSFSLDFRCGTSLQEMMWVSVKVNLVRRPGGEDVLAFMYARDATEAMLNKALLDTVVNESFDYVGYIDGRKKSIICSACGAMLKIFHQCRGMILKQTRRS